jgi:fucose permease
MSFFPAKTIVGAGARMQPSVTVKYQLVDRIFTPFRAFNKSGMSSREGPAIVIFDKFLLNVAVMFSSNCYLSIKKSKNQKIKKSKNQKIKKSKNQKIKKSKKSKNRFFYILRQLTVISRA